MHLGSFIGIIPHVLKRHAVADMRPGDVFVGNDAYEGGGTHLPDLVLAEPIFVDGAIVAWAVNTAHHADFADRGHAHIYQEGLRIPPVRLYRAGVLQEDVQALILLNCQVPHERLSDLRAQMAANRLGVERMRRCAASTAARRCWPRARRCWTTPSARCAPASPRSRTAPTGSPDRFDNPELDEELDFSCEHHGAGRGDAPALRGARPGARGHQHDAHGAALHRVLRGEVRWWTPASCPTPGSPGRCT